jgi:hypothetical protein
VICLAGNEGSRISTAPKSDACRTGPLIALSLKRPDAKTITSYVYQAGLGMYLQRAPLPTPLISMLAELTGLMLLILYSGLCSKGGFAEYPLAIRTPDSDSIDRCQIIYRTLNQLGARIGLPDRLSDEALFLIRLGVLSTVC